MKKLLCCSAVLTGLVLAGLPVSAQDVRAPEPNLIELGIYAGAFFPADNIELFNDDPFKPVRGHKEFDPGFDIGLRLAYMPFTFAGVEGEVGFIPTSDVDGESANIYTYRAHVLGQLPNLRLTPFVVGGIGWIGVLADNETSVGNDIDFSGHFGIGAKYFMTRDIMLRVDFRDVISPAQGAGNKVTNSFETLVGVTWTFGRAKLVPKVKDSDGDGFLDPDDNCIHEPETFNDYQDEDGCPEADSDGDGFWDDADKCPTEAGVEPDGCPIGDSDGDGIMDDKDECRDSPEDKDDYQDEDGCPEPDNDEDGILDTDDQCPLEPENKNGFEDGDGCPDVIPEVVRQFTGVIEGIYFATGKATIKPASRPKLNKAIKVLKEYPDLRLLITGHTDKQGSKKYNDKLSSDRAASVKEYMVGKGIDESRIETKGFGFDKPIGDNKTKKGRAKNRRIEFELIQQ